MKQADAKIYDFRRERKLRKGRGLVKAVVFKQDFSKFRKLLQNVKEDTKDKK